MSLRSFLRAKLPLVLCLLAAGCGDSVAPDGAAEAQKAPPDMRLSGDTLVPLVEGNRWTYRVTRGDATWEVQARKYGGDVRPRGGARVPFHFVYGDMDGMEMVAKSIYAAPETGPEEFFFDLARVRVQHTPPVPLFPKGSTIGSTWTWTGNLRVDRDGADAPDITTTLKAEALEEIETPAGTFSAIRLEETGERLQITRWLVPEVGLVRYVFEGTRDASKVTFEADLTSFTPSAK